MADETPGLSIDTDWKKQAAEEKKRLAEQQRAAAPAPGLLKPGSGAAAAGIVAPPSAAPAAGAAQSRPSARAKREVPPATFTTIVNSMLTQVMLYLGEIATAAGPMVDLDRAKQQVDLLTVLEEKTQNN